MSRCLECDKSYSDQLRRCPYCGQDPADPSSATRLGGLGRAPAPVSAIARHARQRRRARAALYAVAFLAIMATAGILRIGAGRPASETQASDAAQPAADPVAAPLESHSAVLPDPIRPAPVEQSMQSISARLDGDRILVQGSCSPLSIVRVLVDGQPAVISPAGDGFRLRIPAQRSEVVVVGRGVEGTNVTRTVAVDRTGSAKAPEGRVPVTSHAEGETVHAGTVKLELEGAKGRSIEVELDSIINRVAVGKRSFRLFRGPEGLVFLRATAHGHLTFLREMDGQEMVLLPRSLAIRGMDEHPPHGPRHVVALSAFLIDRTEVTCRQYAVFLGHMLRNNDRALRHAEDPGVAFVPIGWSGEDFPAGQGERPVTGISWYAAYSYARWVGGRLPTEAEWERAAAGPLGQAYPWGDEFEQEHCCNGTGALLPADSLAAGASPCGLLHMSGNAREWCDDRFDPRWYLRASRTDPHGPSHTKHRVVRGGSYRSARETLRAQYRDQADPARRGADIGFRVARSWAPFGRTEDE